MSGSWKPLRTSKSELPISSAVPLRRKARNRGMGETAPVLHRNAHAADARLAAPLARFNRNQLRVIHSASVPCLGSTVNDHCKPRRAVEPP